MPGRSRVLLAAARLLQYWDFGASAVPYGAALQLQERLADEIRTGNKQDILLQLQVKLPRSDLKRSSRVRKLKQFNTVMLSRHAPMRETCVFVALLPLKLRYSFKSLLRLQHPPVYTLGKRGSDADFRTSRDHLTSLEAEVFRIHRGGETTFHGPGQVVLYPVVNLRRLRRGARSYVEGLEDTIIDALRPLGISAQGRQPSRTGVWVGDRKIAAIGVQISRGVCTHGLAVNVATDLSFFDHIVPCGIADKEVTSVCKEIGCEPDVGAVSEALRTAFTHEFGYETCVQAPAELIAS